MRFDEFSPADAGRFTVICAGSEEAAARLIDTFLRRYPAWRTQVHPKAAAFKRGLFNKHRSMMDVMVADAPRQQRAALTQELAFYAQETGMAFDIRSPATLSGMQKLRATIAFEVLTGRREFLVQESPQAKNLSNITQLFQWAQKRSGGSCRVILVMNCGIGGLAEQAKDNIPALSQCSSFFEVTDGSTLRSRTLESVREQLAGQQQEAVRALEEKIRSFLDEKCFFDAVIACRDLENAGDPDAMVRAAEALCEHRAEAGPSGAELLSTAQRICRRAADDYNAAEAYRLLGDWDYEAFDTLDKQDTDAVVDTLRSAMLNYDAAVKRGSETACWKAAFICTGYEISKTRSDGTVLCHYGKDEATVYLKKILAFIDAGSVRSLLFMESTREAMGNEWARAQREYEAEKAQDPQKAQIPQKKRKSSGLIQP